MSASDQAPPPVVVTRWRRYGHDRAYVRVHDSDVGYRDLATGAVQCSDPALTGTVRAATEHLMPKTIPVQSAQSDYHPKHAQPEDTPDVVTTSDPRPEPVPDRDLALNPPGSAARAHAVRVREQAPVRTAIARLVGIKNDERAWRIGADAEQTVAYELTRLGPDWRALHAIPVGDNGADIDHLVIGPAGVFTINTKHHPDANVWVGGEVFMVNGQRTHYVRNSRHEARRAARLLSAAAGFDVDVHGIIAVVGAARGLTVVEQPRDRAVLVVARRELVRHFDALPPVLGLPSINRIYEVARHLSTWQPNAAASQ